MQIVAPESESLFPAAVGLDVAIPEQLFPEALLPEPPPTPTRSAYPQSGVTEPEGLSQTTASTTSETQAYSSSVAAIDPWAPRYPTTNPFEPSMAETAPFEELEEPEESLDTELEAGEETAILERSTGPSRLVRGWKSLAGVRSRLRVWVDETMDGLREPALDEDVGQGVDHDELDPIEPRLDFPPIQPAPAPAKAKIRYEPLPPQAARSEAQVPVSTNPAASVPPSASVAHPKPAPPPDALNDLRSWLPDSSTDKDLPKAC